MNSRIKQSLKSGLVAIALASISGAALANHHGDGKSKKRRGPPPQAIEACSDLSEGDACQFEGRRGEASGTCFVPPKDETVLACKPDHHKEIG